MNEYIKKMGAPRPPRCSKLVKGNPFTGTRCSYSCVGDTGFCKRHLKQREKEDAVRAAAAR